MKNRNSFIFLTAALTSILFISCGDAGVTTTFPGLEDAHRHWKSLNIKKYSFHQLIFGVPGASADTITVSVDNNTIIKTTFKGTDIPLPAEKIKYYKTADQLFDLLFALKGKTIGSYYVDFDTKYGYPVLIIIDPSLRYSGDEYWYDSRGFRPE